MVSFTTMRNIAIILAGGSGKRAGGDIPKQFQKIAGKTILEYSIERFEYNGRIDEIAIVGNMAYLEDIHDLVATRSYQKIRHILPGGTERYHSVLAALEVYGHLDCNLLIHDAVRPLVSERIIREVIDNLNTCHVVNVAVPATDSLIETDSTHTFITSIPDRNRLFHVQTPQGFRAQTLEKAYSLALQDTEFTTTDDCSVIKKYLPEENIRIVRGDNTNLKLTYAEDFILLEYLLKKEKES